MSERRERLEAELAELRDNLSTLRYEAARATQERDDHTERFRELASQLLRLETDAANERQARAVAESRLADAEAELAERKRALRAREREISHMQATRVWRVGRHYWRWRDKIKRMLRLG
jgi:chromosome segregation ATPase